MEILRIFVNILFFICASRANYHGPFLLWGPSQLNGVKNLPALQVVDEKFLTLMYAEAKAIILFVRNGTSKLNKENFPSFSELISKNKWAYFPQENLPAKPVDYNSNVEVITLVGPASQQDIELGALFRDAETIYGLGKVLGILSNQVQDEHFLYKRDAIKSNDGKKTTKDEKDSDNVKKDIEVANQRKEDGKIKDSLKKNNNIKYTSYSLFYREGNAILYTKSIPQLALENLDINVNLTNKIAQSETWDSKGILSVKFATEAGTILLRFNFPLNNGYWYLTSVDVEVVTKGDKFLLPIIGSPPYAPKQFSYKCTQGELLFKNENGSLRISDFQVQAHLASGQKGFSDAYDCVGFMTAAIWSGLLVSSLLIGVTFIGILALLSIKTPNRFESSRNKQLTFTVQE